MTGERDSFWRRVAAAARPRPLIRLTLSPQWARWLIAAGAQRAEAAVDTGDAQRKLSDLQRKLTVLDAQRVERDWP